MGTTLGDALVKKGLVDRKTAAEAARKAREERDARRREADEAERRAIEETGKPFDVGAETDWKEKTR